jgi:drug/metabolite transporter (DMT)-like permease
MLLIGSRFNRLEDMTHNLHRGAILALTSALLFGVSTPFAKLLVGSVHPAMLAGLIYLGSGVGLLAVTVASRLARGDASETSERLGVRGSVWLGLAILSGGVIGPLLLMAGLSRTPASSASLLLNLEGVLTALLAWFVFRENFDRRVALGMASIVAGAAVLSWQGDIAVSGYVGPLAVAGACLAWGLDNNLTRKVSLSDPVRIAMLKGLVSGPVNLLLALALGAVLPPTSLIGLAAVLGFLGYGVSLVLFVLALRELGTARTGAYYSTAPFVGALVAVLIFHEPLTLSLMAGGLLMGLGVWLHLTERHEHDHSHEPLTHTHSHSHDLHHRHAHNADDPQGEPHTHRHTHVRLRHRHAHYPDAHHQHLH